MKLERLRVGPRSRYPSRRRDRAAVSDAFIYPVLHLCGKPRHPASAKPYPLGELAGHLKARDVREAVRNSIDRFQLFLTHKFLCHRTLPSKREHRESRNGGRVAIITRQEP